MAREVLTQHLNQKLKPAESMEDMAMVVMVMDMVMVMVDIITGRDPLVILMHLKTMLYLKDQLMLGMAMGMAMVTAIAMDMDMVMAMVVMVTAMYTVTMVGSMVMDIMEVIINNCLFYD